jgi:outer membrane protein
MKKYILTTILSFIFLIAAAQRYTEVFISYLPAVPFGETADFTPGFSPRGVDFEANRFLSDDISIGFNVAWTIFRNKVSGEIFEYQNLDIYGTQFRYQNMVPLNINFKKYFINGDYSPYLGVGLGTQYAEIRNDLGVFSFTDDKWLFHFAPEVGLLYDLSGTTIVTIKAKYNYSPKAGDFPSVSYLSFGIGIGIN